MPVYCIGLCKVYLLSSRVRVLTSIFPIFEFVSCLAVVFLLFLSSVCTTNTSHQGTDATWQIQLVGSIVTFIKLQICQTKLSITPIRDGYHYETISSSLLPISNKKALNTTRLHWYSSIAPYWVSSHCPPCHFRSQQTPPRPQWCPKEPGFDPPVC